MTLRQTLPKKQAPTTEKTLIEGWIQEAHGMSLSGIEPG
jgi:hypothetical protein